MAGGRLKADPLYQGLTRPAMLAGVTYNYFLINMMVSMVTFINTNNVLALLVAAPIIHLIGYYICLKEPRFLELIIMRYGRCMKCRNRIFHGFTNSYDPF